MEIKELTCKELDELLVLMRREPPPAKLKGRPKLRVVRSTEK